MWYFRNLKQKTKNKRRKKFKCFDEWLKLKFYRKYSNGTFQRHQPINSILKQTNTRYSNSGNLLIFSVFLRILNRTVEQNRNSFIKNLRKISFIGKLSIFFFFDYNFVVKYWWACDEFTRSKAINHKIYSFLWQVKYFLWYLINIWTVLTEIK